MDIRWAERSGGYKMKTFADFGIHINRIKGGNQKTTCPNCSPTRKNKLDPCLSVNLDDGTFYCHHCEWKGAIRSNNGGNKKNKIIEKDVHLLKHHYRNFKNL